MSRLSAQTEEKQLQTRTTVTDERHDGTDLPVDTEGKKKAGPVSPDPEVPEKAKRRRFSAKYKLRILREADACTKKGQLGALLRREGLYSSHLTTWRRQREEGSLQGLAPKKRGRKPNKNRKSKREAQLERENRRLRKKLEQAETIIEIQKKVAALLGNPIESPESDENS
jgi:transposase-like protein